MSILNLKFKLLQDMKKFIPTLLFFLFLSPIIAISQISISEQLIWEAEPVQFRIGNEEMERWMFQGAHAAAEYPELPLFIRSFSVNGPGVLDVQIVNARYESITLSKTPDAALVGDQLQFQTEVVRDRRSYIGKLNFVPIRKNGAGYEKLVDFELRILWRPSTQISFRGPNNTENSVLQDGSIYKIAVSQNGIHKLTYTFLKDELGMDLDNIDPRKIQLFGNGGGMLPTYLGDERIDDLQENHIQIVGEEDGSFDTGDYLLFYAEGPNKWVYDAEEEKFNMIKNIYDERNYYFIKVSGEDGLRVSSKSSLSSTEYASIGFNDYARLEEDKSNLLHNWAQAQGSGQNWFGDHFKVVRSYNYDGQFNFPNLVETEPVDLDIRMMLRANQASKFNIDIAGQNIESTQAGRISSLSGSGANEIDYARSARVNTTIDLNTSNPSLTITYPPAGEDSEGWLDYIQLNVRRSPILSGEQMAFRDVRTLQYASASFQIGGVNSNTQIWDISNPLQPSLQEGVLNGSNFSFGTTVDTLKEFIAFQPGQELLQAEAVGQIENQNVHGIDNVDMLVIYHEDFASAAQRFADHRSSFSDLNIGLVRVDHIFNEFASGRLDATAIRDFCKMVYDRNDRFKYLLLFGDGSFDPRDIYELGNDFIPVYENDSMNPIFSFPTDDYFGLLTNDNPGNTIAGNLTIGIGRFPVKTPEEAEAVVDKIINYDNNPDVYRDWRNRLLFVGDDEDGSVHTRQADQMARIVDQEFPSYNIDKIYLDAFPQISTPGGQRFPSATEALNTSIFKGVLAITYLGHGGAKGWAQERVLSISDILSWQNMDQLPLFLTATCSFTGYDDGGFTTAGEEVFLNEKGGAIALLTTVRAVYSSLNADLTEETIRRLFERQDNQVPTLGDVIRNAKNSFTSGSIVTNSRKFALIGDPAQKLGIPEFSVATTKIDEHDVADGATDTLRALQRVTIEGVVLNSDNEIYEDFNGILYPTIYDKKITTSTLGQDQNSSIVDFTLQKNIIFKGRASVNNGRFSFTFVIPKDINYQFGTGKISYYASDEGKLIDAGGNYENIIIGGTDPNALEDDQGPKVEVFMNTEDFVFGGITNANPTLLVTLEDDNGINVVGNSIGHDLEGVLDENTQNTYLLNDFYESELDDYTKGKVRFPLSGLEEGRHQISVKAWDVANNSAEGYTEFIVVSNAKLALEHVLNYPNPFTDYTCFQFDHNLANTELDVLIQIYTVSGRLVKTLEQSIFTDGAIRLDNCIEWDGRDDYGDILARGVYLYKVKVRAANTGNVELSGESDFEKLVILK
jgi:hypothetical protein